MKKMMMMLLLASGAFYAPAQNDNLKNNDEIRTIFSKDRKNGGYGAFSFAYGKINGKDAFISGGRGMFIFDHLFGVGFGGYGFFNDIHHYHNMNGSPAKNSLTGGYGGVVFEPIIGGKLPVHLAFPILIGVGGVAINENDWWDDVPFDESSSDTYFVFEPTAELEFNLVKFIRASATLSYRFTSEIGLPQIDPDAIEGLTVGLTLKLGKF